jgi:hypothetical protein
MMIPNPPGWQLIMVILDGTAELLRQAGVLIKNCRYEFSYARGIYRTQEDYDSTDPSRDGWAYALVLDDDRDQWRLGLRREKRREFGYASTKIIGRVNLDDPNYIERLLELMPRLFEMEFKEAFIADLRREGVNVNDDGKILINGRRRCELNVQEDKVMINYDVKYVVHANDDGSWRGQITTSSHIVKLMAYEVECADPQATAKLATFIKKRRTPVLWRLLDGLTLLYERHQRGRRPQSSPKLWP